jgi:uncharacterized membrane protein
LYFFLLVLGASGFFFAVVLPQAIGLYAFSVLAALGGFGVALYIFRTKRGGGQLVCPVGSNCNAVINSRYSKFLGLPIEYLGMAYYFIVVSAYTVLIFLPGLLSGVFLSALMTLTAGAFLFSLYLLFAQAFLLRQWCIWCLLSAMLSIVIFVVSLASIGFAVTFLAEISTALAVMHSLGFILGLGGAITATFLFSKFLSDRSISKEELGILQMLSELIWLGLALTVISQLASYVAYADILSFYAPFLVQTLALFVAVVMSAAIMIIFEPFLTMIPFSEDPSQKKLPALSSLRRPVFITGAVALSSWSFAFAMDHSPSYGMLHLILAYAVFLLAAVCVALIWERKIEKPIIPE